MLRKLTLVLLAAFLLDGLALAQNLVINPSFEDQTDCPETDHEIWKLVHWDEVEATSDYYSCSYLDASFPARTGDSYIGISVLRFDWSSDYREYVGQQLASPLVAGQEYYVEFWARLSDGRCWSIDALGAYFTTGMPVSNQPGNGGLIHVEPQIINTEYRMLEPVGEWKKVCGTFIASGGEDYVTLGNFYTDQQTNKVQFCPNSTGSHDSYYHIDDVVVELANGTNTVTCDDTTVYNPPADLFIEPGEDLFYCEITPPNVITPNGDGYNDYLAFETFSWEGYEIHVFNRWGKEVFTGNEVYHFDGRDQAGDQLPEGSYMCIMNSSDGLCSKSWQLTLLR